MHNKEGERAMLDLARTVQLVKGALLDPEPTWQRYLPESDDWKKTAALLTGPLIVAAALVAFVLGMLTGGPFGFRPTLASLIVGIVSGATGIVVVTFIFSGLASVFGGKHDFSRGLAATSLAFVPGYVGQALGALPWVGWLIAIGLAIYGLVLLWRIIPLYLEVPESKRAPHYSLSLIASVIAMFVISAIVYGGAGRPGMNPQMNPGMNPGMNMGMPHETGEPSDSPS
jgi:hypothetical protein